MIIPKDEQIETQLRIALQNYTPGIDRAVKFVTIDQVDMLAEFFLKYVDVVRSLPR